MEKLIECSECKKEFPDEKIINGMQFIEGKLTDVSTCIACLVEHVAVPPRFFDLGHAPAKPKHKRLEVSKAVIPPFEGKPSKVVIADKEIAVASWCGVLETVLAELAKTKAPEFNKVVEGYPRFVGKDKAKFSRPKQLNGGDYYFEGRIQTKKLLALFQAIRTTAGFTPDNMRVVA